MKNVLSAFLLLTISVSLMGQTGKVSDNLSMPSKILKMDRKYAIYLPPDYATSERSYPVLYLLHGAGDDQTGWIQFGEVLTIADEAIKSGSSTAMIIVMPDANTTHRGYANDAKGEWRYEDFFMQEFMPYIEKNYRIKGEKKYRAIAGLSMGGGHTQTITNNNPGFFNYIGVFSMGIMGANQNNPDAAKSEQERDAKIEALKNSGYKLYWIGVGKDDFLYQSVVTLRNTLDKHNFKYTYRESTGGHTWANWRIYLSEFAPMLFK